MKPETDTPRFPDATIRVDHLPPEGRALRVAANEEEREQLAAFLELSAIESLSAEMTALPFRGGIRVQGSLRARIVQPSVVTLEPVVQEIDEPIDRVFLPGLQTVQPAAAGAEVFVDLEADELADPLEGPDVDLSDLVIETLALAIDPYPRREGESVEDLGVATGDDEDSPFAALKTLKDSPEKP
jgi:uncharacterized metal-binding protein YceD (DUF177 family)